MGAITGKKLQALRMICEGAKPKEAAARTGLSEPVISTMLQRDDARNFMFEYAKDVLRQSAAKAAKVLVNQLESNNEWIVQNAASRILQYLQTMEATNETTINVNFGAMPKPGLPSESVAAANTGSVE